VSATFAPVDPALAAVIEACRERLLDVARPAIAAEFEALQIEGHDLRLVSTALIGACSQMLFEAIYSHVQPAHRMTVAMDATARLLEFVDGAGRREGLAVPPGVTVQ
jgi:hypothetical protein